MRIDLPVPSSSLRRMKWPHAVVALAIVAALGVVWLIVREGGTQLNQLAERVLPGTERSVTETFREYLLAIRAARGDELLVAEVHAVNEIIHSDTRREFWTGLSLGTSTVSIRYPVTYRYAIHISDTWRLRVDGGIVLVRRPILRALEPAIDTTGIDFRSENGWLRWNKDELRDRLLAQLSPDAVTRAAEHAKTAAPHADAAVAAFVRGWLLAASGAAPRDAEVVIVEQLKRGVDIRVGGIAPQPARSSDQR
jgi:hypothetical protein